MTASSVFLALVHQLCANPPRTRQCPDIRQWYAVAVVQKGKLSLKSAGCRPERGNGERAHWRYEWLEDLLYIFARHWVLGNPEFNALPILTFIHLRAYTHVHMQNMHIHTHAHAQRELTQRTTHQVLQEEADAIAAIRAAAVITPPAALRHAQT